MSVFTIEAGLAVLGIALLCLEAFMPATSRRTLAGISIGGVLLALILFAVTSAEGGGAVPAFAAPFYQNDALALFYKGIALVITLLVLWLTLVCAPYLERFCVDGKVSELFSLPLIVCAGMMWMASARDLVSVFVSLELVTVSFYVMVAYTRKSGLALEAGVKYLILGALSTGVLVYGIAWVYGATGSLSFDGIAAGLARPETSKAAALLGAALLIGGLAFKVAAAPFHMWVPDVYQGAPTPVTAFLSVGSKAAGFAVLTRVIQSMVAPGSTIAGEVTALLMAAGAVTVLIGSLPAIFQTSFKRLLAYSSISHAGYLVLALAAGGSWRFGLSSGGVVAFYLATYLPMTVLGFLAVGLMRVNGLGEDIKDFGGMGKRSPLLAVLLTVALASLAGLPLTAGFMGKLFVFLALADHAYWGTLACAVIGAAAGFYYYFRTILVMFTSETEPAAPLRVSGATKAVGAVLAAVILVLGVYPRPLQQVLTAGPAAVATTR